MAVPVEVPPIDEPDAPVRGDVGVGAAVEQTPTREVAEARVGHPRDSRLAAGARLRERDGERNDQGCCGAKGSHH
jgi:hypothetical protein